MTEPDLEKILREIIALDQEFEVESSRKRESFPEGSLFIEDWE